MPASTCYEFNCRHRGMGLHVQPRWHISKTVGPNQPLFQMSNTCFAQGKNKIVYFSIKLFFAGSHNCASSFPGHAVFFRLLFSHCTPCTLLFPPALAGIEPLDTRNGSDSGFESLSHALCCNLPPTHYTHQRTYIKVT